MNKIIIVIINHLTCYSVGVRLAVLVTPESKKLYVSVNVCVVYVCEKNRERGRY